MQIRLGRWGGGYGHFHGHGCLRDRFSLLCRNQSTRHDGHNIVRTSGATDHNQQLATGVPSRLLGLQQGANCTVGNMLVEAVGAEEQSIPHLQVRLIDLRREVLKPPTDRIP